MSNSYVQRGNELADKICQCQNPLPKKFKKRKAKCINGVFSRKLFLFYLWTMLSVSDYSEMFYIAISQTDNKELNHVRNCYREPKFMLYTCIIVTK